MEGQEAVGAVNPDPNRRFSCFSTANNAFVAERVAKFCTAIRDESTKRSDLAAAYDNLLRQIGAHVPEVWDTEPRQQILHEIQQACHDVGWRGLDDE